MYTGTRLTMAIHRRLLSPFFLKEEGRLYTGYNVLVTCFPKNLFQEPIFSCPAHVLLPAPLLTVSTDLPSYLWSCDLWVFHTKNNRFLASVFNNRVEWLQICIVEARFLTGSPFLYRLKIKGTVPNYTRKLQKNLFKWKHFFLVIIQGWRWGLPKL